jgi:hypothetical protein
MAPTASLHEVVMKVPAPAMNGNPTVQTAGSHSTQWSIPKVPKLRYLKRNSIRQELRTVKMRLGLPSHTYPSRWGSFSTWMRAPVTPGYCWTQFPIYSRLLYHFISPTTHCWSTRWWTWLRHCAIRRKVVGSIFHWLNPSGRNIVPGSTQPLTEIITTIITWG